MKTDRRVKARLPGPPPQPAERSRQRVADALGRPLVVGAMVRLLTGTVDRRGVVTALAVESQEVHVEVTVGGAATDLLVEGRSLLRLRRSQRVTDAQGAPLLAGALATDLETGDVVQIEAVMAVAAGTGSGTGDGLVYLRFPGTDAVEIRRSRDVRVAGDAA